MAADLRERWCVMRVVAKGVRVEVVWGDVEGSKSWSTPQRNLIVTRSFCRDC